jgi:TPR repeat protein
MNYEELKLKLLGYTDYIDIVVCYYYGKHVTRNIDIAKDYYLKAANLQCLQAYSRLCDYYRNENQLAESFYYEGKTFEYLGLWKEAILSYQESAKHHHPGSMFQLASIYNNDKNNQTYINYINDAHRIFHRMIGEKKTIFQEPEYTFANGLFQYVGPTIVVKKDEVKSVNWCIRSAVRGHEEAISMLKVKSLINPKAAFELAQIYELGKTQNLDGVSKIIMLYEFAERKANAKAAFRLGKLYQLGELGVKKDLYWTFGNWWRFA